MPRVHRNLHSLKPGSKALPWSYYQTSGDKVQGSFGCVLRQVTPKHPTGKAAEACRNGTGYRAVFAWLRCEGLETLSAEQMAQAYSPERIEALQAEGSLTRLRLNPKADKYFHTLKHGHEAAIYHGSKLVILTPEGRAYTTTESIK
jgi:hypothetical protein